MSTKKRFPELRRFHTLVFDFDGIFTDNRVFLNEHGEEFVACSRGDGLGIKMLKKAVQSQFPGLDVFILSAEINAVVGARAKKLGLAFVQGVGDKLEFLEKRLQDQGETKPRGFAGLLYLGNDLNDLAVMERAGFSIAPSDAHPRVRKRASMVLKSRGGAGFVREFVEGVLKVNTLSLGGIHELVSHR